PPITAFATALKLAQLKANRPIKVSLTRYQKNVAPSMLRNWNAILMQTPIRESVTISRTIVPVLLATAPNWDSAASARKLSAVPTIQLTTPITSCPELRRFHEWYGRSGFGHPAEHGAT